MVANTSGPRRLRDERGLGRRSRGEGGFTIIEFMIAAAIMTAVLGGTVMLATQLQRAFNSELDDTTVQQEARFTLDWIAQALRNAGSNPYDIEDLTGSCLGAPGMFGNPAGPDAYASGIQIVPNGIRIHADINPPDGLLSGAAGFCEASGEDITIVLDAGAKVITRDDNGDVAGPETMTEPIFTALLFTYFDSLHVATANSDQIAYVHVALTGQSLAQNMTTGGNTTSTLETEVRLRTK